VPSRFFALVLAGLFAPSLVPAQTSSSSYRSEALSEGALSGERDLIAANTVSVRELSIPEKARRSFQKGTLLLAAGNSTGSIVEFKRAIAAYHSYYEAYYQLGEAQLTAGSSQEATDAFSKSIELSGGRFARAYFALSLMLSHDKNFAEAGTLAKTGLSLEPGSLLGQFSLSWAEMGLGRTASAEKILREVLQRKQDFREARLLLTEIHRRQNNFPELLSDVDAYLKLDSTSPASAQLRTLRDYALQSLGQPGNKTSVATNTQP
jgi:tetratricopeptide (TPR) repeat protein